jgi:hypothetical protein
MDERSRFHVNFWGPTGGLLYHLKAWRYRKTLWSPFLKSVDAFLTTWRPPETELIIIGASGGHTLPTNFLFDFDKLTLVDPDPMAKFIFQRVHGLHGKGSPEYQWHTSDFIFSNGSFKSRLLIDWLAERPNAALLFSNILGQLPLINDDEDALVAWWAELQPFLAQRSWASYHDLFSFAGGQPLPSQLPPGPIAPLLIEWAGEKKLPLEIVDHGTSELLPSSQNSAWVWLLTPRQTHIVGHQSYRRTPSLVKT